MANVLKHRFASGKADGPDGSQVQPSHWNDGHAFAGGAAGDVLTRDPTDVTYGAKWAPPAPLVWSPAWSTWSVIWTLPGGGTGLFLGNGTIAARYMQEGKRVTMTFTLIGGSTTGFGSGGYGYWAFTLPVPCLDPHDVNMVASIWSNAGAVSAATALGVDTSTFNLITPGGTPVGPTAPVSWWGNTSRIQVSGVYFTP